MKEGPYVCYMDGSYRLMDPESWAQVPREERWSARLGTGIFGLPNCPTGNRGPKERNEVILAVGDKGLEKLIMLGFVACPSCKPDTRDGFWKVVEPAVRSKYGMPHWQFMDRNTLPFDARRVNFEEILPETGRAPSRLYVPKGLCRTELSVVVNRFGVIGKGIPKIGYYDLLSEQRFVEYF
jgi:hypothetical protein